MLDRVINFIGPFAKTAGKAFQRPYGQILGIDRLSHLANVACELCVSGEIMNQMGVGRSEETFAH